MKQKRREKETWSEEWEKEEGYNSRMEPLIALNDNMKH